MELTFLVPYDGSDLSRRAIERADALGEDRRLVVCTVVPESHEYAREKGWLDDGEQFDPERITQRLRQQIHDVCPRAEFRWRHSHAYANAGDIATALRDVADEVDADVIFLGSENVGRVVTPIASIGSNVATRVPYDIYLVRSRDRQ